MIEFEAELEVVEQVGGHGQGGKQRDNDGDDRGDEEPAPHRRHETGDVDLVEADEEEEDENADAEQDLKLARRVDETGSRAEYDAGDRVGDDRVELELAEDPFGEFGDDDQQSKGEQSLVDHGGVTSSYQGPAFARAEGASLSWA